MKTDAYRRTMELIKKIVLDHRGERVELLAGIPARGHELAGARDLMRREYVRRGYIPADVASLEDEYDAVSTYFVTYVNQELLAAARIVDSPKLPTENIYYQLEEPEPIKGFRRESLREVSRLTALKRPGENPLPRHLTSTTMISTLIDYGFNKGLRGGISTIKVDFLKLFEQLKLFVFHEIPGARLIYPRGEVLSGFFYDNENPAVPIYYLHDESKAIFDGLFHNMARTGRTLLDEPVNVISFEVLD